MGLSNRQFDSIMAKYDDIRLENHRLQLARVEEVREKIPSYFDLEDDLRSLRMERMQASLNKDADTLSAIKAQEDLLILKRDRLLTDAGYLPQMPRHRFSPREPHKMYLFYRSPDKTSV